MLRIRQHSNKNVGIWRELLDIFSESNVIIFGLILLRYINIVGKDGMSFLGKVNGHGETHVTQSDKADFCEWEYVLENEIHFTQ